MHESMFGRNDVMVGKMTWVCYRKKKKTVIIKDDAAVT